VEEGELVEKQRTIQRIPLSPMMKEVTVHFDTPTRKAARLIAKYKRKRSPVKQKQSAMKIVSALKDKKEVDERKKKKSSRKPRISGYPLEDGDQLHGIGVDMRNRITGSKRKLVLEPTSSLEPAGNGKRSKYTADNSDTTPTLAGSGAERAEAGDPQPCQGQ
jgi:hypothetical protein